MVVIMMLELNTVDYESWTIFWNILLYKQPDSLKLGPVEDNFYKIF